uniref:Uncharacterized protein n=1 Tax=Knipowitschia caucasica TaxID=637954 RepID=A0AAV2KBH4_KNICA
MSRTDSRTQTTPVAKSFCSADDVRESKHYSQNPPTEKQRVHRRAEGVGPNTKRSVETRQERAKGPRAEG